MKRKKVILSIIAAVLILLMAYIVIGNPFVLINNFKLQQSVTSITSKSVELNQIVPFAWDTVYTFAPYTSKDEIENTIGIKSNSIQETVSEGMVHLIFVKNKKVVASVCGYASNLGYQIDFSDKIAVTDNAVFNVQKDSDVIVLSHIQ